MRVLRIFGTAPCLEWHVRNMIASPGVTVRRAEGGRSCTLASHAFHETLFVLDVRERMDALRGCEWDLVEFDESFFRSARISPSLREAAQVFLSTRVR